MFVHVLHFHMISNALMFYFVQLKRPWFVCGICFWCAPTDWLWRRHNSSNRQQAISSHHADSTVTVITPLVITYPTYRVTTIKQIEIKQASITIWRTGDPICPNGKWNCILPNLPTALVVRFGWCRMAFLSPQQTHDVIITLLLR